MDALRSKAFYNDGGWRNSNNSPYLFADAKFLSNQVILENFLTVGTSNHIGIVGNRRILQSVPALWTLSPERVVLWKHIEIFQ